MQREGPCVTWFLDFHCSSAPSLAFPQSHESANPTSYLCWLQVGFLALETKLIKKTAKTRRQGLHRADLGPEYLQLVLGEPGGLCGPGVQKDRGVLQQASESGLAWAGRGRKGCLGRIWLEETGLPSGQEAVVTQRSSWCRGTSATPNLCSFLHDTPNNPPT